MLTGSALTALGGKKEDAEITKELCFVIFVTNPNGPSTKHDKILHFHIKWFS
jgi:hypothetical protein